MEIIIPIKQVPETGNVKMDEETGTIIRQGVESIVNPLDLYAIETGIQIREQHGGRVRVITMGPPSAEKALREAMAMGCDDGVLITGKEFAGSDTWATSYTLAKAIEEMGGFDLILAGERATDGDTGQVGPGIASFLGLTLATYTSKIRELTGDKIVVERLVEEGYEVLQLPLPTVLTVVKEISYPRLPTLRGKQRARQTEIKNLGPEELGVDKDCLGLQGSPTRVVNIDRPKVTRKGKLIDLEQESTEEAVAQLLHHLQDKELI